MARRAPAAHARMRPFPSFRGDNLKSAFLSAVLLSALLAVSLAEPALAQSASCNQLDSTLSTLSRNRDFRNLRDNEDKARTLGTQLRDAESAFVRSGCQAVLNAGQKLSSDCMRVARVIVKGREDYKKLQASIETGQAVAQQREVALQQIARFLAAAADRARRSPPRSARKARSRNCSNSCSAAARTSASSTTVTATTRTARPCAPSASGAATAITGRSAFRRWRNFSATTQRPAPASARARMSNFTIITIPAKTPKP